MDWHSINLRADQGVPTIWSWCQQSCEKIVIVLGPAERDGSGV